MVDWRKELDAILDEPRAVRRLKEKEPKDIKDLSDLIFYKKQCLKELVELSKRLGDEGVDDAVFRDAAGDAVAALGSEVSLLEIEKKSIGKGFFSRWSVRVAMAFLAFASGFFMIFALGALLNLPVLGELSNSLFGFFNALGLDSKLFIYVVLAAAASVFLPIVIVFLMARYR